MPILRNMPFADYLALSAAHFSAVKEIDVGPEHYAHALANDRPDTDALRAGRAIHSLILTPDACDVVTYTGRARRGKEWERFAEEHAGRTILTGAEAAMAEGMRASVAAHPVASALLSGGDAEVTLTWDVASVGPCKGRVDYLQRRGHMVELKTTRVRGRSAVMREATARLYYAQAAFYLDGLTANGLGDVEARMIVIEKLPPYAVHVLRVTDHALEPGRRKVEEWLEKIARCLESGVWRGDDESDLQLAAYALAEDAPEPTIEFDEVPA